MTIHRSTSGGIEIVGPLSILIENNRYGLLVSIPVSIANFLFVATVIASAFISIGAIVVGIPGYIINSIKSVMSERKKEEEKLKKLAAKALPSDYLELHPNQVELASAQGYYDGTYFRKHILSERGFGWKGECRVWLDNNGLRVRYCVDFLLSRGVTHEEVERGIARTILFPGVLYADMAERIKGGVSIFIPIYLIEEVIVTKKHVLDLAQDKFFLRITWRGKDDMPLVTWVSVSSSKAETQRWAEGFGKYRYRRG